MKKKLYGVQEEGMEVKEEFVLKLLELINHMFS